MPPRVENPANLRLPEATIGLLERLFANYGKIIIIKEFAGGFSGGRVLEVRPVRKNGTPELPTIIKVAAVSLITQEWQAYRNHVQNRLPKIAKVTDRPVLDKNQGVGGLRYDMMGEGTFEVISLRDCAAPKSPPNRYARLSIIYYVSCATFGGIITSTPTTTWLPVTIKSCPSTC